MAEPLSIHPLQWSALPDLRDAPPLDATDTACLAEVAAVLARHGKMDRFAIHLAHRHFMVGADEVLLEYPDPDARRLVTVVAGREEAADAIPTTWLFANGGDSGGVFCACATNPYAGGHTGGHIVIKPPPRERPAPERER